MVVPSMAIGLASAPLTGSSTLLVFEAKSLSTVTLIDVPAGIVTSRDVGTGGAAGAGDVAGEGLDAVGVGVPDEPTGLGSGADDGALAGGVAAGALWAVAVDCGGGGACCEHAMTSVETSVSAKNIRIIFYLPANLRGPARRPSLDSPSTSSPSAAPVAAR